MKKAIKLPWGERDGEIIHVAQVVSGKACACNCISCGAPLIARKGPKMTHHFGHTADATCGESALHKVGKILLKRRLDRAIQRNEQIAVNWECDHCRETHSVSLLAGAVRTDLEVAIAPMQSDVSAARADIGVFDAAGALFAGVEIVVTHAPEESAMAAYRAKNLTCIEVTLEDEQGLAILEGDGAIHASRVNQCTMPRCPDCSSYLHQRKVHVVDADCWKCGALMKIAFGSEDGMMFSPPEFVLPEVAAARSVGALLEVRYSKTVQGKYLANVCSACRSICGDFFLHDFWERASSHEALAVVMRCENCETLLANSPGSSGERWKGKAELENSEPDVPVESGIGVQEALRRMIWQPADLTFTPPNKKSGSPPPGPKPAVEDTTSKPLGAPSAPKPKAEPLIAPQPRRSRWGKCGGCGKASCPTIIEEDSRFFCSSCGRKTQFISGA